MKTQIKHMTIVEYFKDDRPSCNHRVDNPTWNEINQAIKQMDNYCYPIVLLSCIQLSEDESCFDDEDSFNIIGGNGKLALFHFMAEWQYENSYGGEEEVRLWDSDQGYFCQEKNIIYDIELALRIVKEFYETCSYNKLDNVT